MTITLDVTEDYLFFDNMESVDLELRSISEIVRLDNCALKRQVNRDEQQLYESLIDNRSVVWDIPVAPIGDYAIQAGDYIHELSPEPVVSWTVVSAALATFGTRWRCVCNRQRT